MSAPRRILVTGASGFVGRHLMRALAARFPQAALTGVGGPEFGPEGLDITDEAASRRVAARAAPDVVIHLAGMAAVTQADREGERAMAVNAGGARIMAEAIHDVAPEALFILISSGEAYGESLGGDAPTPETAPLRPITPYGCSKQEAERLTLDVAAKGLHVLIARPFNHTGPGQTPSFVAPAFAAQIAAIEAGLQPPEILVGSLADRRDFTDVRDVAEAYALMAERGNAIASGTAINIASGIGRPIADVLEMLRRLSRASFEVKIDPARLRSMTARAAVGDPSLAAALLGWRASTPIETTLADVLDDRRKALSRNAR